MVAPKTNKQTEAIELLRNNMVGNRALDTKSRDMLIKSLGTYDELKIVANKPVLNKKFFSHFVKENNLDKLDDSKLEKKLEKFFFALAKLHLIHKSSASFKKGLSFISISPNPVSLTVGLHHIDNFMSVKREHYGEVNTMSFGEKIQVVYNDLRLFQMTPLHQRELQQIDSDNIIFLDDDHATIYLERVTVVTNEIAPYKLIDVYGVNSVAILKEIGVSGVNKPFESDLLEVMFKSFKKSNFGSLSMSGINMTRANLESFHSSPLAATLLSSNKATSPVTLSELNALYPNAVSDALMEEELKRIVHAMSRPDVDDAVLESERELFSLEALPKLQELLKIKIKSEFTQKSPAVKSELKKLINNDYTSEHVKLIVEYILHLLEEEHELESNIEFTTFKGYVGLLNKHFFTKVEDFSSIQNHEVNEILSGLERLRYKNKSIKKTSSLIRRFFEYHSNEQKLTRVNVSSYPKSLIFDNEIDEVLSYLDSSINGRVERQGARHRFKLLQYQVLLLIGFYTGLRKSELRSRLLSDICIYGNKLCVDVNKDGLKKIDKKLKTKNSKRRVCTIIPNDKHLTIIHNFMELRKSISNKSSFMFLRISHDNTIRSKAVDESVFDEITEILQSLTGRYVSFHSLRHSYASYSVKKILEDSASDPYTLINLSISMGHETPETTLKVYTHRSVLDLGGAQCH